MDPTAFLHIAVLSLETAGAVVMLVGFVVAIALGATTLARHRDGSAAFSRIRRALGGAILLGLEVLVAADILKSVGSQLALEDVLSLGLIVVIRTILSFTIQIEIEGRLPWQRALFESGASHLMRAIREPAPDAPGTPPEPLTKEGG